MKAELIAVGSQLLRFGRADGNGVWLTERLNREGVEVVARSRIEDDVEAIGGQVRTACGRAGLVPLTGGLGPTDDDRTRQGLARGLVSAASETLCGSSGWRGGSRSEAVHSDRNYSRARPIVPRGAAGSRIPSEPRRGYASTDRATNCSHSPGFLPR